MTDPAILASTFAAVAQWEALGAQGFVVSVAYGPIAGCVDALYSVSVLAPDGEHFVRPYAARDLAHAIEIADLEITKRGWRRQ